ncbi:hypothetical protein V22_19140 [Calycomorphotria hydatis]|uniref:Uncharacterized protein n=2 Tax=Calycomorphotria hydatis TaxID=2528027 RepID=A0A517T8I3_9PLAN|nr:hypothetical protein V22_19140 [Calycomorphotria hydatis]
MQGYPRVAAITHADDCCTLHLDDSSTILLDLSRSALEAYLKQNEFPPICDLLDRDLIVAIPLPLRMTESEWDTIADILRQSEDFRQITRRFPKLLTQIHQTYDQLHTLPHHLYCGIGMYLEGKGLATFYTSHPIDFQSDEQKGKDWYFKLLVTGDNHLVWTYVNIRSRAVETQFECRPWHYVTNASAG